MATAFAIAAPCVAVAQSEPVDPWDKPGSSKIPSYYQQLSFDLTSPTTWATAVGGYANPGVYTMMPGGEMEYYWSDQNQDLVTGWRHWGLFTGGEHLGFGAVHNRLPTADGTGTVSVTDYRLGLSVGNKSASLGAAYGWSGGDKDAFGRTRVIQIGTAQRWNRYVTFGAAGIFSTEERDQSGLFDVGVRPLGDERIALFGDLELPRGVSLKNAPWSAGAMFEWPAGLRLVGRYYENESWTLGLAYSFGGGVGTGHLRVSGSPRFDKNSDVAFTNWGVRLGYPERGFIGEYFQKDRHYLAMNLKGKVLHTRYKYFDTGNTLIGILTSLEDAKNDSRVNGVVLNLSGMRVSRGDAWEIREKLKELQESGMHVVTVADRVVMDPEGFLVLPGYVLGRTYLAGTMEKLGLGFDEWRFLKYKSAAEMLSRTSMSDADREQRQALTDGYYDNMQADVSAARGIKPETFDRWIDEVTLVIPSVAKEEGMVDALARWEDVPDIIEELEGKRKSYVGAGSLSGRYYKTQRWGEPPSIAVVYAIGECAMDKGIRARQLERLLIGLRKSPNVKAVVLRVNSPGGSALASDLVAEAMLKCSKVKPVIVSQGDVAASGGYWISMNGDVILAQPTTVTGSIGVIGGWVWDKGIGEKLGIDSDFVKRGEHADLFTGPRLPYIGLQVPHRPMTESERAQVIGELEIMYGGFVEKVAKGRGMDKADVEKIAQGRVWTGAAGVENGLIDEIGGLEAAIKIAREKAGLDPDDDFRILDYGTKGWFNIAGFYPSPIPFLSRWFEPGEDDAEAEDGLLAGFLDDYEMVYLREIIQHNGRPLFLIPPEYLPREARVGDEAP
jgi:protease-4